MPLITTPPLPVYRISRSPLSGQITITFRTPYLSPLFLYVIYVTQVSSGPPVVGNVFPGLDATHGGRANLQVNPAEYAYLSRFVPPPGPFYVEVTYDTDSGLVVDIVCVAEVVAMATEATLSAVKDQLQTLLPHQSSSDGAVYTDPRSMSKPHPSAE